MTEATLKFDSAGNIEFKEVVLMNSTMKTLDVSDYVSEITIQEDILSPVMHGKILFVDSRNLIKEFDIIGEEFIYLKLETPTSNSAIEKVFRIYGIENRMFLNDKGTQSYVANFVSAEAIQNAVNPLFRTFEGKISNVVTDIFTEFLKLRRHPVKGGNGYNFVENGTELFVYPTLNDVKFVSPGWTPFKCINWCASKSIPEKGKASNYLFFETNKAFMFTNLEVLFDVNDKDSSSNIGTYTYKIANLDQKVNPNKNLFKIQDLVIKNNFNHLDNYNDGYFGNRLLSLDIINKTVRNTDYITSQNYDNYIHTDGLKTIPFFKDNSAVSTLSDIKFNPIHPGLHNIDSNANEKMPTIYGNRKTNMLDLNQMKLEIFVPGRTDIEVGRMLKLIYPDASPRGTADKSKENEDKKYTGSYLITAINHKFNQSTHMMSMEIVKDGFVGPQQSPTIEKKQKREPDPRNVAPSGGR
jgi:hypothetical protein